MAEEQQMKRCSKCGKEYPATTEYFTKCKASKDGFYWQCKECKHIEDLQANSKRREWAKEYMRDRRKNDTTGSIIRDRNRKKKQELEQSSRFSKSNLTVEYLRSEMNYNASTGRLEYHGSCLFTIQYAKGYRVVYIDGIQHREHRLVWFYMYGTWPKLLDHINGDKSDNRIENLRIANTRENSLNTRVHREGKLPGANPSKYNTWRALVKDIHGVPVYLGEYSSEREASLVYCRYCLEHGLVRREFMPSEFTDEELGIIK